MLENCFQYIGWKKFIHTKSKQKIDYNLLEFYEIVLNLSSARRIKSEFIYITRVFKLQTRVN